ncbi:MAG TPA: hypothetical protein VJB60_02530 [Candidatus Peribacterales bacterium]|nr:hypothetical protein [Candidatus Peribacterales bacterium]
MRKHVSIGMALMLLITGCSSAPTCTDIVKTEEYSLCLIEDFEQVPDEELRAEGVPEETVAAFELKEERGGQRDNVVITRERVKSGVAPLTYAEANMKIVEKSPEYNLVEKREITVDSKETILHIFTARPVSDLPARRFYQVSFVKGTTGYVVTGTLPYSVDETIEEGLITMLMSVSFTPQE